jgi:hypothetical protein
MFLGFFLCIFCSLCSCRTSQACASIHIPSRSRKPRDLVGYSRFAAGSWRHVLDVRLTYLFSRCLRVGLLIGSGCGCELGLILLDWWIMEMSTVNFECVCV